MQVPVSMLGGTGSAKAAAVIAILAGLAIVATMSRRRAAQQTAPPR